MILRGLSHKTLTFHGKHFAFDSVPMALEPLQKPHPPLWYGAHSPDSAARAARRALNVINLDPTPDTQLAFESYRMAWHEAHGAAAPLPKLGLGRFVVVAETDGEALRLARRAYAPWHQSFTYLFRLSGRAQTHPRPAEFDALMARGQGVAGSPATVRDFLAKQVEATGFDYIVGQFNLRRHDARQIAALDRPIRQRGHAGAAHRQRGRIDAGEIASSSGAASGGPSPVHFTAHEAARITCRASP